MTQVYVTFFFGDFAVDISLAHKNPSFADMVKAAKSLQKGKDDKVEEFVIKKQPSTHYKGILLF